MNKIDKIFTIFIIIYFMFIFMIISFSFVFDALAFIGLIPSIIILLILCFMIELFIDKNKENKKKDFFNLMYNDDEDYQNIYNGLSDNQINTELLIKHKIKLKSNNKKQLKAIIDGFCNEKNYIQEQENSIYFIDNYSKFNWKIVIISTLLSLIFIATSITFMTLNIYTASSFYLTFNGLVFLVPLISRCTILRVVLEIFS